MIFKHIDKHGINTVKLSELIRYPVKSMGGNTLAEADILPTGLPHDREWLVATPQGGFVTARKFPKMLLWQADARLDGLVLTAPDGSCREVSVSEMTDSADVTVWKDSFAARCGSIETDKWLSEQLGMEVRLYWLGKQSRRMLSYSQTPLSFADGAPFLLTNTASLTDLNHMLDKPVEMARFRANLVVSGGQAYEEEQWHRIRIGEVEFENFKPCTRCVMTTVDLQNGQKDPSLEPLKTLAKVRNAVFGVNLVALNQGRVRVGDEVEVLSYL
nr:MOSC domain-containing protein [Neisseria montereyensis]